MVLNKLFKSLQIQRLKKLFKSSIPNIQFIQEQKYPENLIFCTKGGSISFLSKSYSGSASDRVITEDCNAVQKFHPGFIAMFDKGCLVQDAFLPSGVTAKIPPFASSKQ